MKTCSNCGKKSPFMKLFPGGLCERCFYRNQLEEKERKRQEKEAATEYAHRVTKLFTDLTSAIETDTDPIKALDILPEIQSRHEIAKELLSLLDEYKQYPGLYDFLRENRDQPQYDYWTPESFADSYKTLTMRHDHAWDRISIQLKNDAQFHEMLSLIPRYNITLSEDAECNPVYCTFKPNTITVKSSYSKLSDYVVIDVETTGLSSRFDRIIEIAAIRFEAWEPTQIFETLINPETNIVQNISDLTGITDEMVLGAPKLAQILNSLDAFIGNSNIIGHNLAFDLDFLSHAGWDYSSRARKYYDTLQLARSLLKKISYSNIDAPFDVEDHKLTTLCTHYMIRSDYLAHRAASDCLATGILFHKLVSKKLFGI